MHLRLLSPARIALAFALLTMPLGATTLSVNIGIVPRLANGDRRTITITARKVDDAGNVAPPIAVGSCVVPATACNLELAEGSWLLKAEATSVYAPIQSLRAGGEPIALAWTMYQTASLTGTFDASPPAQLRSAKVTVHAANASDSAIAELPCPITGRSWKCDIPQGEWDIRLRVPGFVSYYAWDLTIGATGRQLGVVPLRAGASLVGFVAVGKTQERVSNADISVLLTPKAAEGAVKPIRTRPNAKGFFHFDEVDPGEYTLTATHPKLISTPEVVRVIDGREAELRNHLVLESRRRLDVSILPLVDARLRLWSVELAAVAEDGRRKIILGQSSADDHGNWSASNVRSGHYLLTVKDQDGGAWLRQAIEVATADSRISVEVPVVPVEGAVRYGDKSVPAKVTFSKSDVPGITLTANDEGILRGYLPIGEATTSWKVRVDSEALFVTRTFDKVELKKRDGVAQVELQIAATHVSGIVVKESGEPVSRGIVSITTDAVEQPFTQADVQKTGEFIVNGLPQGRYKLRVETFDAEESDTIPFEVRESDSDAEPLRVVVKPVSEITGLLYADSGPISGVKVWTFPTDAERIFSYPRTTDAHGRFAFRMPPGSHECDVFVQAPGFATRVFHRRIETARFAIRLEPIAGELRLTLPKSVIDSDTVQPYLVHDGATIHALMAGQPDANAVVRYLVEPGQWSLCLGLPAEMSLIRSGRVPAQRCLSAVVPPYGVATLEASALKR